MKMLRCLPSCLLVGFGLFFAGCAGGSKPGGFSESLVAVYATEASLAQHQLTITVNYTNDNIGALGFAGAKHKVFLNGTLLGNVTAGEPFGIPPMNSVRQSAIVEIEHPEIVRQLLASGASSTVAYRLESALAQRIGDDSYNYNLSAAGSAEFHPSAPPAQK